jgi:hypothetical protein
MILLIDDDNLRTAAWLSLVRSLADSVIPTRPDRTTPRYLNTRKANFHHNSKSNL